MSARQHVRPLVRSLVAGVAVLAIGVASADVVIPSSAFSAGRNSAEFHSDVRVFNPTNSPIDVTPVFYRSDGGGNVVNTVRMPVVTIAPRQQVAYDNVLQGLFGQSIGVFGPIRFEAAGRLVVSSSVNNVNGCGNGSTSGQWLPGIDTSQALRAGTLVQLAASADAAAGYRSNVDFMNPGADAATVTVKIRRGDGKQLSTATISVGPNGLVQKAIDDGNVFPGASGTTDTNLWLEFTSDVPVLVFASVINNGSGDPFAIFMTAEPPAAIAIGISATTTGGTNWTFAPKGVTLKVGQPYVITWTTPAAEATAHGMGGLEVLGIASCSLITAAVPCVRTFTPTASQIGLWSYACTNNACGTVSQHGGMSGTITIAP